MCWKAACARRRTGCASRGQLIDATTGAHLWAERFEGALDDIFELQDQVTDERRRRDRAAAGASGDRARKRKPTESLDAYDYYLRGMANVHRGTREAINEALPLFYKAIQLDPDFASAYGMAAWCHFWRKVNGWMTDRSQEIAEGTRLARRAVELGRDDAVALARSAMRLAISSATLMAASPCSTGR